jgi:hypothetical protein
MYSNVYVIGLCGKARSGKDTFAVDLADALNRRTGVRAVIRSFAGPIKNMLSNLLFLFTGNDLYTVDDMMYGSTKEIIIPELGKSPREMMQTLGTEWGRDLVDEDIWMSAMKGQISNFKHSAEIRANATKLFVIIPDVRFDNEAEMVDELIQIRRKGTEAVACHTSEGGIRPDLIQATIDNDYDLGYLTDKAEEIAKYLLGENEL